MRCRNCGWENPTGVESCQKCNRRLYGFERQIPINNNKERAFTVLDTKNAETSNKLLICSKCNYPATNYSNYCPNCGEALIPIKKSKYKLVPIGMGSQTIPLYEGDIIEVGGLKFVFQQNNT